MAEPLTEKERVYDAEIYPLMKQILEICKREKINMATFFSLGTPEDGEGLLTCNSTLAIDETDEDGFKRANQVMRAGKGPALFARITTITKVK